MNPPPVRKPLPEEMPQTAKPAKEPVRMPSHPWRRKKAA
jgi:hypothetical protein